MGEGKGGGEGGAHLQYKLRPQFGTIDGESELHCWRMMTVISPNAFCTASGSPCVSLGVHTHTCTHTHAHTHMCTHTHAHTLTHTRTCARTHTHTHSRTRTHTHAHTHTHVHAHTHTHKKKTRMYTVHILPRTTHIYHTYTHYRDDDMISIASQMSISNLSTIGFLEDDDDDDMLWLVRGGGGGGGWGG